MVEEAEVVSTEAATEAGEEGVKNVSVGWREKDMWGCKMDALVERATMRRILKLSHSSKAILRIWNEPNDGSDRIVCKSQADGRCRQ